MLTPLGSAMLGKARRLCALADESSLQAAEHRTQPVRLCVPEPCELSDLASVVAVAHRVGCQIQICRCDVCRGMRAFQALAEQALGLAARELYDHLRAHG